MTVLKSNDHLIMNTIHDTSEDTEDTEDTESKEKIIDTTSEEESVSSGILGDILGPEWWELDTDSEYEYDEEQDTFIKSSRFETDHLHSMSSLNESQIVCKCLQTDDELVYSTKADADKIKNFQALADELVEQIMEKRDSENLIYCLWNLHRPSGATYTVADRHENSKPLLLHWQRLRCRKKRLTKSLLVFGIYIEV